MALYLVQHGRSLPRETDPGQGLSDEGRREVETIAAVARSYGVTVGAIWHSGKKRALQTAGILARALDPAEGFSSREGLNPLDDVQGLAPSLEPGRNLMLVGHLPFLSRLLSLLVTGSEGGEIFAFQNGGIVCLDRGEGAGWVIRWTLMPRIG